MPVSQKNHHVFFRLWLLAFPSVHLLASLFIEVRHNSAFIIATGTWSSPNVSRALRYWRMRGTVCVEYVAEMRNVNRTLAGKPQGKLGKPRCRWKNNIERDLTEIACYFMEWIQLPQGSIQWWAFVNIVMDLCPPPQKKKPAE
jgi:hypothetical protein